MNKFTAVTVLSKENPQYFALLRSAKRFGWPLRSFFFPEDPLLVGTLSAYHDFISHKHLHIAKALNFLQREGFEQFLFLDAWDTAFVAPPAYDVLATPLLTFSGGNDCYPDKRYSEFFDRHARAHAGPFPYLNSGVIWGPVERYMEVVYTLPAGLDQLQWIRRYVSTPEEFRIDSKAEVALTLFNTKAEDLSRFPDGVRYNPTSTWPCVLHAAGKWPMPSWLEA